MGVRASTMGVVEAVKVFPWPLLPGMVAASILVKEGGFGSIGAFVDETLDYLEKRGGYIITEVCLYVSCVCVCMVCTYICGLCMIHIQHVT